MADLEIDDDIRERFAYLFKPVTDFAKNFEIDIIEVLQEYDNRTLSSETGFNFVNAAAMLQGTTSVYGRRVDMLHKAVLTFKAEFSKEPTKKKPQKDDNPDENNKDEEAEDGHGKREAHVVYKTMKSYPIHISREREYQLMFLMPGSMMPLLATEKRPVELLGNYGKFGEVDDYRMCRDLVVHNYSLYCNPGGTFCYSPSSKADPCEAITTKVRQFLQSAHGQNLLPQSCAAELETTLQNNPLPSARTYMDLVEICRRVSDYDGPATTEFIHRLSHHITLEEAERRKTELQSQPLTFEEPPAVDLDYHSDCEGDFSFAGISFNVNGEILAQNSINSLLPTGPVTRSRNSQNDTDSELRRSARLLADNQANPDVDLLSDEFNVQDMYAETIYKNKPFVMSKKRTRCAHIIVRRKENKARKCGELPLLQKFLDTCFWTRDGTQKKKNDPYEFVLHRAKRYEVERRKAIRSECRKKQMQNMRMKRNQKLIKAEPEVSKNAKKSLEVLQQKVAESFMDVPDDFDPDDIDDFGDDFAASPVVRSTPQPLGDIISDHVDGIDLQDLTHLSLHRKRSNNLPVRPSSVNYNESFGNDYHDDIGFQPLDELVPTNASINNIVTLYLSRKWNLAVKRQPECQERLIKWERKMVPKLADLTDDYLAHHYGKAILEKFEGEIGRKLSLNEITGGNVKDRDRYFLALLMLTNRGVVLIYPPSLDMEKENRFGRVDGKKAFDFDVELLDDADWHGTEMNKTGLLD